MEAHLMYFCRKHCILRVRESSHAKSGNQRPFSSWLTELWVVFWSLYILWSKSHAVGRCTGSSSLKVMRTTDVRGLTCKSCEATDAMECSTTDGTCYGSKGYLCPFCVFGKEIVFLDPTRRRK